MKVSLFGFFMVSCFLQQLFAIPLSKEVELLPSTTEHRLLKMISSDYRQHLQEFQKVEEELLTLPVLKNEIVGGTIGYQTSLREQSIPTEPIYLILDFGSIKSMNALAIFPAQGLRLKPTEKSIGFPREFKVELLQSLHDEASLLIYHHVETNEPGRNGYPIYREFQMTQGRYLRLEIQKMSKNSDAFQAALAEIMVFHHEKNIAFGSNVIADFDQSYERGPYWSREFLVDGQQPFGIPYGHQTSPTSGYTSPTMRYIPEEHLWAQIDLGKVKRFDELRFYAIQSYAHQDFGQDYIGYAFPPEYLVEGSNYPDMRDAQTIVYSTQSHRTAFHNQFVPFVFDAVEYRYLTVSAPTLYTLEDVPTRGYVFGFSELGVYQNGEMISKGANVKTSFGAKEDLRGTALMKPRRILPNALADGYSTHHNIPPLRKWTQQLARKGDLVLRKRKLSFMLVSFKNSASQLISHSFTIMMVFLFLLPFGIWFLAYRQRQKQLFKLREQISSDLHDDIGSNISSMRINSEIAVVKLKKDVDIPKELSAISQIAKDTNDSLRDIMWILQDHSEESNGIPLFFRNIAERLLGKMKWSFREKVNAHLALPLQIKRHFTLFYKEALHNIAKHSQANLVQVYLEINAQSIQLKIQDDGQGIQGFKENDLNSYPQSLWLRSQKLQANLMITSSSAQGTRIQLDLKV